MFSLLAIVACKQMYQLQQHLLLKVIMIDPVLKKFGLSQARKSVKNLQNTTAQALKTPSKPRQSQARSLGQNLSVPPQSLVSTPLSRSSARQPRPDNRQSKFERLMNYLQNNYCTVCPNHNNERNLIKFICLRQSCPENLGCAECFLYRHSDHEKCEIGICLRDLQQINGLMKDSFDIIISQKSVIKSQFVKQIDLQITNMYDQFHKSMEFFKNKALKQIDDHLFTKYQQLQFLSSIRNSNNAQLSDAQLVLEISKIDIKGIQRNLSKQLHQLSYEKLNYQPIIKLFEQMNGALGHFMSQFKKCFPKIYRIRNQFYNQQKTISKMNKKQEQGSGYISQFKSGSPEQTTKRERNNEETLQ